MKRILSLVAAVAICAMCSKALAIYLVIEHGTWPKSWPKQLESLRDQSRTLEGPHGPYLHFAIRFTDRDQFETAWPHILKVKTKGAPIVLVRGENFFLGKDSLPGLVVHSPPAGGAENRPAQADKPATGEPAAGEPQIKGAPTVAGEGPIKDEGPIEGVEDRRLRWMNTTYIELVVDGQIVDLNRIPLPKGTPIIDERFTDGKEVDTKAKP
jgi:hypothetical protein